MRENDQLYRRPGNASFSIIARLSTIKNVCSMPKIGNSNFREFPEIIRKYHGIDTERLDDGFTILYNKYEQFNMSFAVQDKKGDEGLRH